MKLNKLTKKDLELIAEAEAINASVTEIDTAIAAFEPAEVIELASLPDTIEAEAVAQLEALEQDAVIEAEAHEVSEPQATDAQLSFDDLVKSIGDQERQMATVAMAAAIDTRAAFEKANGNDNIQKTLKKAREQLSLPSAGAVLLACGVDDAFVNRSVHDGKRYNVYAFGKLADAIKGLSGGAITNKINFAIMRSLFNARRAGVPFTGEVAKMAASDKIRVIDAALKAILIRHTVSAVTAATQASSTMQAMETLGLVRKEGGHRNPTYTLTDHPAVAKLEEVLAKAA